VKKTSERPARIRSEEREKKSCGQNVSPKTRN
jgi:hypothetical protein